MRSIIADNCWSYFTHQLIGESYATPIVDVIVPPTEYFGLVNAMINEKIDYTNVIDLHQNSLVWEYYKDKTNPNSLVVRIDNQFDLISPHITNFEEYKERFIRRSKRFNPKDVVLKFALRDPANIKDVERFINLKFDDSSIKIKKVLYLPKGWYDDACLTFSDHTDIIYSNNLLVYNTRYVDEYGAVDDPVDDGHLLEFIRE